METRRLVRYCRCGTRLAGDNSGLLCSACQRKSPERLLTAPSVPPEFWLADRIRDALCRRHMGAAIYAYRNHSFHGTPIAQAVVARWAGISQAQLSRIESDGPMRDLGRLIHWAHTLHIPQRLLWFDLGDLSEIIGSADVSGSRLAPQSEEVSPSRRRDFVRVGGFAAAGQVLDVLEHELNMIHITLDRGTTSDERTARLEDIASDLGIQCGRVTPRTLIRPALKSLHSVRILLEERQPTRQQVRLIQASAKLSTVIGEIMFNMGHFKNADDWYRVAEHAAHDVGDRYLADIALAGQALVPTYSGDPGGVISLLEPRLGSNPAPSPAIAWLWGFKARAYATLNEPADFKRSIECSRECLARSPAELIGPGIFSFLPARLAFYEATGSVMLHDPTSAIEAADRALSLYDPLEDFVDPALTKLERANALAQAGEIPEACRVARESITGPHVYYGPAVAAYARKFGELIRGIQSAETREWREAFAELDRAKSGRK